uniref:EGF-like-domain, multiple 6 n=1 Tax=Cyprinus carpio TaxID=7962 RepID=A0A8C2C509_CYPCA
MFLEREKRQIPSRSLAGVCRYGSRLECCYGWKKNSKGHCEAQCDLGCKHGECVGPNKCKCFPGYTGKTCSQDLNECGLKPRPCEHRCMNTFGSYMCYCLNGYMLMSDGSCANSRTCSLAHCQYGCEEVQGEVRCLCPSPGLQLGSDGKTCEDIDECATGKNQCPFNRQCTNTFGSYYCKCQTGYDLKYVNGKYDCIDINECTSNTHKCSHHAECINTHGSYKCKCKQGFRGSGFDCSAIPDFPSKTRILGGKFDNTIPEPAVTESPRLRLQPFDYEGEVYIGPPEQKPVFPEEKFYDEEDEEEEEEDDTGNQLEGEELNPRGDAFCEEYYLALEGPVGNRKEQARIKLLLDDYMRQSSFCLKFDYRIQVQNMGVLRVMLDNSNVAVWERRNPLNRSWQSEQITITWTENTPEAIIFEAERGRSASGEIGLDHVVLISGPCSDDKSDIF